MDSTLKAEFISKLIFWFVSKWEFLVVSLWIYVVQINDCRLYSFVFWVSNEIVPHIKMMKNRKEDGHTLPSNKPIKFSVNSEKPLNETTNGIFWEHFFNLFSTCLYFLCCIKLKKKMILSQLCEWRIAYTNKRNDQVGS